MYFVVLYSMIIVVLRFTCSKYVQGRLQLQYRNGYIDQSEMHYRVQIN